MEWMTEVISVEDELAIILPAEVLKRLNVSVGDPVDITETASGFRISRSGAGIDPPSRRNE